MPREKQLLNLRPVTARIASRMLSKSLIATAEKTVELSGPTRWSGIRPIMLPDEPDRIKAHGPDSSPRDNQARLVGAQIDQGPTKMHLIRDVIIADGAVLTKNAFDRIAPGRRRFVLNGNPDNASEVALCSTYVTQKYFGHWLKDGVAHEQLAANEGLQPVVLDRAPWVHEPGYRELLDLEARRTNFLRCDRLWLLEDSEINLHFRDRYESLRRKIRTARTSANRVFLSRGQQAQGRRLLNEDETIEALAKRGFTILQAEELTTREVTRALANATIVVSPEGSALAHALIAAPQNSAIVAITGAQHFNMANKTLCDALGITYGLTVADAIGDDYRQPIDRLLRTIDLVDAAAR